MKVPLLDLKEQNEALRPEVEAALGRVLDANAFILGDEVAAFERTGGILRCRLYHQLLRVRTRWWAMMALDIGPVTRS